MRKAPPALTLTALLCAAFAFVAGCRSAVRLGAAAGAPGEIHIRFWTFPLWSRLTGKEPDGKPEDWPSLKAREFERS